MHKISPLAPKTFPSLKAISGLELKVAASGIKYKQRSDVLIVDFIEDFHAAGVFTKSLCPSAPVDHCKTILHKQLAKTLIVNSGNANAFTGKQGKATTDSVAKALSEYHNCTTDMIYMASTGVIGEPLDADKLIYARHNNQPADWLEAAKAIMTTDTYPKLATREIIYKGQPVTINAIAKGSGMIAPNMATMLSFIFTDLSIPAPLMQQLLKEAVEVSFNSISVDSDTSTSDTVLFFAKANEAEYIDPSDTDFNQFKLAFTSLLQELALSIIKDGEGATKLIKVKVNGATTDLAAKKIALSIVNSPLVKTAIAGEDANWGRVVMAIGKAGQPADRDLIAIYFGPYCVAKQGERDINYSEEALSAYMKNSEIVIEVFLQLGDGSATCYGCDLTADYITINAGYRS